MATAISIAAKNPERQLRLVSLLSWWGEGNIHSCICSVCTHLFIKWHCAKNILLLFSTQCHVFKIHWKVVFRFLSSYQSYVLPFPFPLPSFLTSIFIVCCSLGLWRREGHKQPFKRSSFCSSSNILQAKFTATVILYLGFWNSSTAWFVSSSTKNGERRVSKHFVKGKRINILGLRAIWSVLTTQLWCHSLKAAIDNI